MVNHAAAGKWQAKLQEIKGHHQGGNYRVSSQWQDTANCFSDSWGSQITASWHILAISVSVKRQPPFIFAVTLNFIYYKIQHKVVSHCAASSKIGCYVKHRGGDKSKKVNIT